MPRPDQLKQPQIITLQFVDLNPNDDFVLDEQSTCVIYNLKLQENETELEEKSSAEHSTRLTTVGIYTNQHIQIRIHLKGKNY